EVRLGVERPQRLVLGDAAVERRDEPLEGRCSADGVVERGLLLGHVCLGHRGAGPRTGGGGGATPAASSAALIRSRSSRWTAKFWFGAHLAKVRIVIVVPEIDSTPTTSGFSRRRSAHCGSASNSRATSSM